MSSVHASTSRWSELDGIRSFAVAGVLAVHFSPGSVGGPWAEWGVRVFYVLSGFLITYGLLSDRARGRPGHATRDFFIRRALRLWPLYFAVLAVTIACNVRLARPLLPWNAAFATNYYIYIHGAWISIHSHLWSLAIEQQFYLLWPFLILLVPTRLSLTVVLFLIMAAPVLRGWDRAALSSAPARVDGLLLPMCADYLAWGALLALIRNAAIPINRISRHGGACAFSLFSALYLSHRLLPLTPWRVALDGMGLAVAAALLIAHCIGPDDSLVKRLLRLRPLVYLGTISYGIYIIHNYTHWLGPALLRRLTGHNYFAHEAAHVAWLTALSIALAAASWHFFERPIARAGRRHLSM